MMDVAILQASLACHLVGTLAGGVNLAQPGETRRRIAAIAVALGVLFQALAIGVRSADLGTFAVTSFGEQVSLLTCLIGGVYLLAQLRYRLAVLGAMVGPIGFIGALTALIDRGVARDVPPGLYSPLFPVHVTLAFLGNAALAFACLVSVIYLWQESKLKAHSLDTRMRGLPSLETLDQVNFRCLTWGFVLLTLGILSGVLWAELSFGRLWSWEPATIRAILVWGIYAVLLHGRVTVGWGGRRAAALTIVGFGFLFISFIGVNLLAPGQHGVSFG
jgi:cytochrome c-type biogenesis protein CcsB